MMKFKFKEKLALLATIFIIVIVGFLGYYFIRLKQGPYPSATFVSVTYKWGVGDTLVNVYDSSTGAYQYLDKRDSLVKTNLKLRTNNIIYLHNKANEFGLWELPEVIANDKADLKSQKVLRYEMELRYEDKTKKIVFMTDYDKDATILTQATQLQELIAQTIREAEERY